MRALSLGTRDGGGSEGELPISSSPSVAAMEGSRLIIPITSYHVIKLDLPILHIIQLDNAGPTLNGRQRKVQAGLLVFSTRHISSSLASCFALQQLQELSRLLLHSLPPSLQILPPSLIPLGPAMVPWWPPTSCSGHAASPGGDTHYNASLSRVSLSPPSLTTYRLNTPPTHLSQVKSSSCALFW